MSLSKKNRVLCVAIWIAFAALGLLPVVCFGQLPTAAGGDPLTVDRATKALSGGVTAAQFIVANGLAGTAAGNTFAGTNLFESAGANTFPYMLYTEQSF